MDDLLFNYNAESSKKVAGHLSRLLYAREQRQQAVPIPILTLNTATPTPKKRNATRHQEPKQTRCRLSMTSTTAAAENRMDTGSDRWSRTTRRDPRRKGRGLLLLLQNFSKGTRLRHTSKPGENLADRAWTKAKKRRSAREKAKAYQRDLPATLPTRPTVPTEMTIETMGKERAESRRRKSASKKNNYSAPDRTDGMDYSDDGKGKGDKSKKSSSPSASQKCKNSSGPDRNEGRDDSDGDNRKGKSQNKKSSSSSRSSSSNNSSSRNRNDGNDDSDSRKGKTGKTKKRSSLSDSNGRSSGGDDDVGGTDRQISVPVTFQQGRISIGHSHARQVSAAIMCQYADVAKSIVTEFSPFLRRKYPNESYAKLLQRLMSMWSSVHTTQRMFGMTCNANCSRMNNFDDAFGRGDVAERRPIMKIRRTTTTSTNATGQQRKPKHVTFLKDISRAIEATNKNQPTTAVSSHKTTKN